MVGDQKPFSPLAPWRVERKRLSEEGETRKKEAEKGGRGRVTEMDRKREKERESGETEREGEETEKKETQEKEEKGE